mgnify:CR=1 FL=1
MPVFLTLGAIGFALLLLQSIASALGSIEKLRKSDR